jgi:exosome complex exonuclease RRP6
MTNDEIMLDASEETPDADHAHAKAARKAARKQKKKDDAAARAAGLDCGNEPAFDYANAKSVLHAEDGDGKKKKKDKKKKSAAFAPFSGMSDAPKGLPRAQKEVPGRSKTFTR